MQELSALARRAALESYELFDLVPERVYDDITTLAATICNTPIAFIALVDHTVVYIKSHYGEIVQQIPVQDFFVAIPFNKNQYLLLKTLLKTNAFTIIRW